MDARRQRRSTAGPAAVPSAGSGRAAQAVRSALHRLGYRFRLGPRGLPGDPAVVLARLHTAVLVVDCARHPHPGCRWPSAGLGAALGRTANAQLAEACDALAKLGWESLVIQACEAEDSLALEYRLDTTLQGRLIAKAGPAGAGDASAG